MKLSKKIIGQLLSQNREDGLGSAVNFSDKFQLFTHFCPRFKQLISIVFKSYLK